MYLTSKETYSYQEKRDGRINMKKISWEMRDTDLQGLIDSINNGHAFTHNFQNNQRRKENFINACFIAIDVDGCKVSLEDTLDSLGKKPTMVYYTASNQRKDDGYRFRLIYVFKQPIEENEYVPLTKSLMKYLEDNVEGFSNNDDCSKVINQFYFGNDKSESTMIVNPECVYAKDDFPHAIETSVNPKNKSSTSTITNSDNAIDIQFMKDYHELTPYSFLEKYHDKYQVQDHSREIDYRNGAFIYDKDKYEEIFRPIERYQRNGKCYARIKIFHDGDNRRRHLYADAVRYRRITPDISIENLIYDLIFEIYGLGKYDNEDNQLDVIGIAQSVMNIPIDKLFDYEYTGRKRRFSTDIEFCKANNLIRNKYSKVVGKQLRMEEAMKHIDKSLSILENVALLNEKNIKISYRTLRRYINFFLHEVNKNNNNIPSTIYPHCPIAEKKKYNDDEILELYNRNKSLKENLLFLKENKIFIGKDKLYQFCRRNGIETNPNKKKGKNKK